MLTNLEPPTLTLVVGTSATLLLLVGLGIRTPLLLRMGLRNSLRRPGLTVIGLSGLILASIFLTASFVLQDSFNASEEASRQVKLGLVDESISGTWTQSQFTDLLSRTQQTPGVQRATGILIQPAAVADDIAAGDAFVYAVPPTFDAVYGPLTDITGHPLSFAALGPDEVLLSQASAALLDAHSGDHIQVTTDEGTLRLVVRGILMHDLAVTTGEVTFDDALNEVLMPLATLQTTAAQLGHPPLVPNVICVRNQAQEVDAHSQPVVQELQHLVGVAPINPDTHGSTHFPTDFGTVQLHPLTLLVVSFTSFPPINNKGELTASPAARQFFTLLPAFTGLLISASVLLLVLLCLLLALERRAELGLSRALGLQRSQLLQTLLLEGGCYGLIAASAGVALGIGATALELMALGRLHPQGNPVPLHLAVQAPTVMQVWCLSLLGIFLVILAAAIWMSRLNIVVAIRNLDAPQTPLPAFGAIFQMLACTLRPRKDGQAAPTGTEATPRTRVLLGQLLWGLVVRGPACLALGALLWMQQGSYGTVDNGLHVCGAALLIGGTGLLVIWLMTLARFPRALAQRIGFTLMGIGWILAGLQMGNTLFLSAFAPTSGAAGLPFLQPPSLLESFGMLLMPLTGAVVIVMSNLDLLMAALTWLLRRIRPLASIARISLVYPLTSRFRTTTTVTLLSLITFLIMLTVLTNSTTIQQGQIQTITGDFHLEVALTQDQEARLGQAMYETPTTLSRDIAAAVRFQSLYNPNSRSLEPIRFQLPGHPTYPPVPAPYVVDDTFLTQTTMPLAARAEGYTTDRQVWNAVRDHVGYATLRYSGGLGLPTTNGFTPFVAEMPTSSDAHAPYYAVTVIGIEPSTTYWPSFLLSTRTAAAIVGQPYQRYFAYYLRLQPGVSVAQASLDVGRALHLGRFSVAITSLVPDTLDTFTANLTLFLTGYLALGLLFGAFAIGVIATRAVIERRQQIGMVRALGFSRALVRLAFLLETGFLILVSLLVGSLLAWWLVSSMARQFAQALTVPVLPVAALLLGSFIVVVLCTLAPAQRAARIPPAEALRYE
ncbi:MAG TPA: FtsX-like permease family protein [Ktedonobacteraceae bacterium]|jgi:putative ABC transport system permease protein|nr:FtsX-like permease family protein [Ktedonobacteraceae bacterium]